ncbi:MAG: hypothetical protein AXW14_15470 [Alteromonas sp. Nap_26]|nr:MAG: hypothetical protein AXW14_15470 [Alteromonas sp. Nap_26]
MSSKPIVIGLAGQKGAGKNYAATILRNHAESMGYTVAEIAYADPIKEMLKVGLGLTDEHFATQEAKETVIPQFGVSPRYLMQTLGTNWGRDLVNNNLWLIVTGAKIDLSKVDVVLVTDVRFDNEAGQIRGQKQGHIAQIIPTISFAYESDDQHESEQGIHTYGSDFVIPNPKNPEFNRNVANVFDQILGSYLKKQTVREDNSHDRVHM